MCVSAGECGPRPCDRRHSQASRDSPAQHHVTACLPAGGTLSGAMATESDTGGGGGGVPGPCTTSGGPGEGSLSCCGRSPRHGTREDKRQRGGGNGDLAPALGAAAGAGDGVDEDEAAPGERPRREGDGVGRRQEPLRRLVPVKREELRPPPDDNSEEKLSTRAFFWLRSLGSGP